MNPLPHAAEPDETGQDAPELLVSTPTSPRSARFPRRRNPLAVMVWCLLGAGLLLLARNGLHNRPARHKPAHYYGERGVQEMLPMNGQMPPMGGILSDPRRMDRLPPFSDTLRQAQSANYEGMEYSPHNFVNLAARVGPYTIAVRRVTFRQSRLDIFSNPCPPGPPDECLLTLELYSPDQDALRRVRDFAAHCTAIDDNGIALASQGSPSGKSINNGVTRYVLFPASISQAKMLRRVEGEILVAASDADSQSPADEQEPLKRLPFRLENIPLATGTHLFGVVSAVTVPAATLAARAGASASPPTLPAGTPPAAANGDARQGAAFIATETQTRQLQKLLPPAAEFAGELHLPARLLMQPDVESRFEIPVQEPGDTQSGAGQTVVCCLTPRLLPGGEIDISGRVTLATERTGNTSPRNTPAANAAARPLAAPIVISFACRLWDNEPIVLLLTPPTANPGANRSGNPVASSARPGFLTGQTLAIRLHCFLKTPPDANDTPSPAAPIPSVTGQTGGELTGQIFLAADPLRHGVVELEIMPQNANGQGNGTPTLTEEIGLDRYGRWRCVNVAPGRYLVRVHAALPYSNEATIPTTLEEYARRRYGMARPVWQQPAEPAVVSSGSVTVLAPARLVDANKPAGPRTRP